MTIRNATIILLLCATLFFIISVISNSFDGDLGWHLRFGKDAFSGNFQYLDSYTWPHFGQPWTNHEWGGDLLFWFLYSNFGYLALVLTTSVAIFTAIFLTQKIWQKKTTVISSLILCVSVASLPFILTARLAMFGPLFFAVLLWSLEKIPRQKTYLLWPIILWLWSAIHGSWILGFIMVNIYLLGNIIHLLLKRHCPKYSGLDTCWTYKLIAKLLGMEILSGLLILINPYGVKIWQEIWGYFSEAYFKQFITEWIPSWAYPIYPIPLILGAACAVFIIWGLRQKKASLAQTLLFFAVFYSALIYKRNILYLVIVCAPILTIAALETINALPKKIFLIKALKTIFNFVLLISALAGICFYGARINFEKNIFTNQKIFASCDYPINAAETLKKDIGNKKIHIFNEFWWGGWLNWTLPNALVYLDGRGTATWRYNDKETMLEHYHKIKFEAGGLAELEQSLTEYIILQTNTSGYARPNLINKIIFAPDDLRKIFSNKPSALEKALNENKKWKVIYEDKDSKVWKKLLN